MRARTTNLIVAAIVLTSPHLFADFEAQIAKVNEALQNDNAQGAFDAAQEAIRLDGSRHEGYLYAGIAHYRLDLLDSAAGFIEKALSKAPASKKEDLEGILKAIGTKKQFLEKIAAAERAEAAGLRGKAAREYTEAWKLIPPRVDVGLKAAQLWIALSENVLAGEILVPISLAKEAAAQAQVQEAQELLKKIAGDLKAEYNRLLVKARGEISKSDVDAARTTLGRASALSPADAEPVLLLCGLAVRVGDAPLSLARLQMALRKGELQAATVGAVVSEAAEGRAFEAWLKEEQVKAFLLDVYGPSALKEIATGNAGGTEVVNSIGMKLVRIKPGKFTMGSPPSETGRIGNEDPKPVEIAKPFYLATTEVNQAQWMAVMGENPSSFKGDDLPVEKVSWNDAKDFCSRLSAKEGKNYRLPTEEEWEYACRAGATGAYGGTGRLDDMGWYESNSGKQTQPVGKKKPNAWGLFDMHGNVWELCETQYDNASRVLRGGSWDSVPRYCRSAIRRGSAPVNRGYYIGFRPALDAD